MGGRWNPLGFHLSCFVGLIFVLKIQGCWSLNSEGLALLEFRAGVDSDPFDALAKWNSNDSNPCNWLGVHCIENKVQALDLHGLSLEGILPPELGKLIHLRSLILYKNQFSGTIPKEIGGLTMLELVDLRHNNLSGTIPTEIGSMLSLRRLLLCDNKFEGSISVELMKLTLLSELQFDENHTLSAATGIGSVNRKFGHWFKFGKGSSHGRRNKHCDNLQNERQITQNLPNSVHYARRRLLGQSSNLFAEPAPASGDSPTGQIITVPTSRSSGAFPAVPEEKNKESQAPAPRPSTGPPSSLSPKTPLQVQSGSSGKPADGQSSAKKKSSNAWKYVIVIPGAAILLIVSIVMFCVCRKPGVTTIRPWKSGLSGQLQKAFVTGTPKLNRLELETACEDFSNIIDTLDDCTVYKGTLSSGVEIAVASTTITSSKDWSEYSELIFRKKIETLSKVNHKNFVNLLGFCEEDEPFNRMMVFEYAPNGTLFEHLHVKEIEHLDWNARTRIIMGVAYCLQYMHDLNPPVAHSNLNSTAIYLTDDYAAKIAEIIFWAELASKIKISGGDHSRHAELPSFANPEANVYSFGILLLEIVSGRLPFSEERGSLLNWAAEYLGDKRSMRSMVDPSLKSFKTNELDVICDVIRDCIQPERPTMREITAKLREVIPISPDAATPRLSPLWWAELEILSVEAT